MFCTLRNGSHWQKAITVDVGWATGLAFWEHPEHIPVDVRGINITTALKGASLELKLETMGHVFEGILKEEKPDLIVIEGTALWGASATSHASASSGDLFQTAYLVGVYARCGHALDIDVKIVTVNQWKGQMTKAATQARVSRAIGRKYPSTHQTDAVGLGLSMLYDIL